MMNGFSNEKFMKNSRRADFSKNEENSTDRATVMRKDSSKEKKKAALLIIIIIIINALNLKRSSLTLREEER